MPDAIARPERIDKVLLWQPLAAWRNAAGLAVLSPWLGHAGSLTEKLRSVVGAAFHVRVLHEGAAPLGAEEAVLLGSLPGTAARLREVNLCGQRPLVYARTLAPTPAADWLQDLNTRPLGDRVFAQTGTERGAIEVARLDAAQPLYRAAIKGLDDPPAMLWARRSVLEVRGSRLLIYECFLAVPEP